MAFQLDLRTAVLVCTVLSFLTGLVLLVVQLYLPNPFRRGLRGWLAAALLLSLAYVALGLRGTAPVWLSVVVGNGLLAAALACASGGIRALLGRPGHRGGLVAVVAVVVVVAAGSTLLQAGLLVRTFLVSLLLAGLLLHALLAIYGRGRVVNRSAHVLAGCLGLGIASLVYRAFYMALVAPDDVSVFILNNAQALTFAVAGVLPQVATTAFLLLCTERSLANLQLTARTDPLTGVMNRRAIEDAGRQGFSAARRHGGCLAVVAIDIDHLKRVNDELGHAAGDELLLLCVARIRASMRQEDQLGRLGGGEFVVVMTDTDLEHAALAAERIRCEFGPRTFPLASGHRVVSVSLGVAALIPSDGHFSELLRRADRAMYAAKEAGRDCTIIERDSRLCGFP